MWIELLIHIVLHAGEVHHCYNTVNDKNLAVTVRWYTMYVYTCAYTHAHGRQNTYTRELREHHTYTQQYAEYCMLQNTHGTYQHQ